MAFVPITFAGRRRLRAGVRNADLDTNFQGIVDEFGNYIPGTGGTVEGDLTIGDTYSLFVEDGVGGPQAWNALGITVQQVISRSGLQANGTVRQVSNPTASHMAMPRSYADGRYVLQSNRGPGYAVAGGRIVSDGSGGQSVANCWGVSSCTISGSKFRVTLASGISTSKIVPGITVPPGLSVQSGNAEIISSTQLDFTVISGSSATTANGVTFFFWVFNAAG